MSNHHYEYIKSKAQGIFAKLLGGRWADSDIRQKPTYLATLFLMLALLLVGIGEARARPMVATAPGLGTAASFAVLGGSTVTNTGPTIVTGNLGVSPGSAVTGFPPGIVVPPSTIHTADAVALQAQSDVTAAYNDLAGQACDTDLTGQNLGGLTLTPAVYCFSSSAFLTGILTLDAQGDPNAVFVFQIGSTLITAPNSSVIMINNIDDAVACNVFWQVGSSATLDTTTAFQGNILALTSITLNTGASVYGRVLAQNGAVTMDSNTIPASCAVATPTPTATSTNTNTPVGTSTNTPVGTSTNTPVGTSTNTPVGTSTNTPVGTSTNTPVGTSTNTPVGTSTLLPTVPGTLTPAATSIETPTVTPTGTNVPTVLDPTGEPVVSQAVTIYLPLVVR